jgi:hypothetical protein
MKISVIGLGWYGEPLALHLLRLGHSLSGTTQTPSKKERLSARGIKVEVLTHPNRPSDELLNSDVIVLNIPPFPEALSWFKTWNWQKAWVLLISSTSVITQPENALLLAEQEEWIQNQFENWTILRFGGLLGPLRHPGKYLSGKKNLPGRLKPVNLLHLDDGIGVTVSVIENDLKKKIYSIVSDSHPTREDFYTSYCRRQGLPLPEFDPLDTDSGPIVSNEEMKEFYPVFKDLDR